MAIAKKIIISSLFFTMSFSALQGKLPESWQELKDSCYQATTSAGKVLNRTIRNISFQQSYADKHPGKTAFAQFCYSHPFLSSAFVNICGFSMFKRLTQNHKGLGILPYISTALGALGINSAAHSFLRNTGTPHHMSPFFSVCTKDCNNTNQELHNSVFQDE